LHSDGSEHTHGDTHPDHGTTSDRGHSDGTIHRHGDTHDVHNNNQHPSGGRHSDGSHHTPGDSHTDHPGKADAEGTANNQNKNTAASKSLSVIVSIFAIGILGANIMS
jgi:hypothetical protein